MEEDDRGLQLLGVLADLIDEFSNVGMLKAVHTLLVWEAEENSCCVSCQRKAIWLQQEMSRLLSMYQLEFPAIDAMAKVNHPGPRGMIQ